MFLSVPTIEDRGELTLGVGFKTVVLAGQLLSGLKLVSLANMYSEFREEARDHARLHNAYFEQARQAYLIDNKALAKEQSSKGQLHNMHKKEAHGKAQYSIYRQRNPDDPEMQVNGRGHERMIYLHRLPYLYLIEEKLSAPRISDADISLDPQVPFVIRRGFGKGTTDYVLFSHESCSWFI
ncbi:hypothetical protein KIW84_075000 [Lathyrus oleraceus]|uniref:DUF1771 domain-containing protein n=1 Tax=Pisum sativum TaxID=3888 RepID=A0A9D4VTR1_PEA|nr:hypothetical protein KIW84_075000 [Pisum sativum]